MDLGNLYRLLRSLEEEGSSTPGGTRASPGRRSASTGSPTRGASCWRAGPPPSARPARVITAFIDRYEGKGVSR